MEVTISEKINYIHSDPPKRGSVLALGVFDGVHLGHQKLMKTVLMAAQNCSPNRCQTGAISFWPHPQSVFAPEKPVLQLTSPIEQVELVKNLGLDYFGFFHFTTEFASLSPSEFIQTVLIDQLAVAGIVVGFNFRFGKQNLGDYRTLQSAGQELGFEVWVCEPVEYDGQVISSTRIRSELLAGNVEVAEGLLGRPYFLSGLVTHGFGRGKKLGFPTANMQVLTGRLVPAPGVYAGRAVINGQQMLAAIFIGSPLTFDNFASSVEVYIPDWSGDLYGSRLQIEFLERLRGVSKFASSEELITQVNEDVAQIKSRWSSK